MAESAGVTNLGYPLNVFTGVTIGVCLVAGPACFGPDFNGKYDRSRRKVGLFHTFIRLVIFAGICAAFYGFPRPASPDSHANEEMILAGSRNPVNETLSEIKEEPNRIVAAPESIQVMIPINGESFKVSFLPKVTALEVAVEFCDSISEKYGLTPQSYHSSCVNPVQLLVAKEVKAHYRRKSKLMMAEAGKRAELAKMETEAREVASKVPGSRSVRNEQRASTVAPDSGVRNGEPKASSLDSKSQPLLSSSEPVPAQAPTDVDAPAKAEPTSDVQSDAKRDSKQQNDAAKAKARAAVELARQKQATKTTARKRPTASPDTPQEDTPISTPDAMVKSEEEIAAARAAVEHEKRLRKEKEMADRIKFVDKRSQARLAALKAKAADREEREKMLEMN